MYLSVFIHMGTAGDKVLGDLIVLVRESRITAFMGCREMRDDFLWLLGQVSAGKMLARTSLLENEGTS